MYVQKELDVSPVNEGIKQSNIFYILHFE